MKSASEMAEKWGYSTATVRKYCNTGVIPPAEKKKARWCIPDDWPRPPMGRHALCFLMDTLYQVNHGVKLDAIKWGYSVEDVRNGFKYLMEAAFISTFNIDNFEVEVAQASVTPRGQELIALENEACKGKYFYKAHVNAKVGIPPFASTDFGVEVSNK